METKDLLGLPWTVSVHPESDDRGRYFVAEIEEIPGVNGYGDTEVEARGDLYEALQDVFDDMVARGEAIPAPPRWTGLMITQIDAALDQTQISVVGSEASGNTGVFHEAPNHAQTEVVLGVHAALG
jgi:predicted RNase H-like HicB family nuclease